MPRKSKTHKHTHLEREKDAHPYIRRARVINGKTCCLCFNITRSYHRSSKRLSKVQSVVLLFSTLTGSSQRNRSHSYSVYFCQCYHIVINQKYSHLTQRNTTHQQQHQVYYSASFIEHWHCVFFLFPHRRMHTD